MTPFNGGVSHLYKKEDPHESYTKLKYYCLFFHFKFRMSNWRGGFLGFKMKSLNRRLKAILEL